MTLINKTERGPITSYRSKGESGAGVELAVSAISQWSAVIREAPRDVCLTASTGPWAGLGEGPAMVPVVEDNEALGNLWNAKH